MTEDDWFSEDATTFGDRLAGAREAAGLTQDALAENLGVGPEVVEAWENDAREPRANRLQMLSGMLGVSLSWLLTGQGEGLPAPSEEASVPADINALLLEMRGLRSEILRSSERLGRLEKRLRKALQDG